MSRARQKTVGRHRNNILRESVAVGGGAGDWSSSFYATGEGDP